MKIRHSPARAPQTLRRGNQTPGLDASAPLRWNFLGYRPSSQTLFWLGPKQLTLKCVATLVATWFVYDRLPMSILHPTYPNWMVLDATRRSRRQ